MFGIVVPTPLLDDDLGFLQRARDFTNWQFISGGGVDAFDVAVLPG